MIDRNQLHRDGCTLLRGAIPAEWLAELRAAFDAGVKPSHQWPVPCQLSWGHSLLDLDPKVQAVCRLSTLLSVVGELIGGRFFSRKWRGARRCWTAVIRDCIVTCQQSGRAIRRTRWLFFDDYAPANGATRIVAGSHRALQGELPFDDSDERRAEQLTGSAGDILIFDADLLHAGSVNQTGARSRSILICYFAEALYASHLETAKFRSIRMDTTERFDP